MSGGKLTALQWRILQDLAGIEPSWTLTGGGALAGVHLKHRTTRDLDLFWHGLSQLGTLPEEVRHCLTSKGLEVATLRSAGTFVQLRVSDGTDACIVDLVADPVQPVESPLLIRIGSAPVAVDTAHEILVNKLAAMLSRSELRDLEDVEALLASGADLERALADVPAKDGGFSPLTLAWVLKDLSLATLARAAGLENDQLERLESFKASLVEHLLAFGAPES